MSECSPLRIRVLCNSAPVLLREFVSTSVLVGRGDWCDVCINDVSISREHVRLERQGNGSVLVRDLGSRNGVMLDGKQFRKKVLDKDFTISLSNEYTLAVELSVAEKAPATGPVASDAAPGVPPAPAMPRPAEDAVQANNVCPHCWRSFEVEHLLAIARHPELVGDPLLGPEAPQRFLPSRFTPEGDAIDARGLVCPDLACPHCHLVIPHSMASKAPVFLSIIGAPASGKSYLLTTMTWEMRSLMPNEFGFAFMDADASSNQIINEYERTLFLAPDPETYVTLEKTEMQGRLYDQVEIDRLVVNLPRPFMFTLAPQPHHPWLERKPDALKQTLVLYDNAGEHFEPGMDSVNNPGTQHLARAGGIFFLLDPTKDPRFRARCASDDPQLKRGSRVERQEILLNEAANRLRRYAATWRNRKYDRPLVVVVTKYDIWGSLLREPLPEPWRKVRNERVAALDMDALLAVSFDVRNLLRQLCPEVVSTAETLASRVTYIPVSSLGHSPTIDPSAPQSSALVVQPKNVKPIWAPVPLLYMMATLGLVPVLRRKKQEHLPLATLCRLCGDRVVFTPPGATQEIEAPCEYLGRVLRCPESGQWFRMPDAQELFKGQRSPNGSAS